MIRAPLLVPLLAAVCVAQPTLGEQWCAVRDAVLPGDSDAGWRAIRWHETMTEGLLEGQRTQRPVLLWAMNGHPLGCT